MIIPVGESHKKHSEKVLKLLENNEIRASLDIRNETIGKKIRQAEMNKIPFMLIVGEKEYKNQSVSVRKHREGDLGSKSTKDLVELIKIDVEKSMSNLKNN